MPYDVKLLNAVHDGEADIADRDAVIEVVAGMVETMVHGHPKPRPAMEQRYRTQLRTLREVMRRLAVEAALPTSLRRWTSSQSPTDTSSMIRAAAEEVFESLLDVLDGLEEREDGERFDYADVRNLNDDDPGAGDVPSPAALEPVAAAVEPVSIFISYSHADKPLAQALCEGLHARGHRVWIDNQELRIGDSLIERVSTAIADIDFFLALVSPASAQSSWCQKELALAVSGELNRKGMRVMPLRVDGVQMPAALGDQLYLEISLDDVDAAVDRLLRDIASYRADAEQGADEGQAADQMRAREDPARPAAGAPGFEPADFEPVRILGVVAQGVGKPLNDGSRGSALYRVPLQLSRRPPRAWVELFSRNWDHPPRFTTMHRPRIGSVEGDTVVLDGTTMDELENVHLDTLRAVMDKTNAEVAEIERREQEAKRDDERQRLSHEAAVRDVSRRLRFD